MKTVQSFRIHFVLRAYLAKDGKAPLYVAVTVNKEKCLIGLKQNIDLNNWDAEKGIPKGNREQVKILNNYLDEVKLALGNCYKELMLKGRLPTAATVKDIYLYLSGLCPSYRYFVREYLYFLRLKGTRWKHTRQIWKSHILFLS